MMLLYTLQSSTIRCLTHSRNTNSIWNRAVSSLNNGKNRRLTDFHKINPFSICTQTRLCSNHTYIFKKYLPVQASNNINLRNLSSPAKRPFDIDVSNLGNIVVFSYNNDRLYRYLSIFGIIQFGFWVTTSLFLYNILTSIEQSHSQLFEDESTWGKVLAFQVKYKYRIAVLCMLVANLVLAFAYIAPQRAVHKLILLNGGKNLNVTTYSHLGTKKNFTVPLENISFARSRQAAITQLSMKVKGRWMYFLVDKRDGEFHDTELFDHVIGLERKL